jgi:predicted dehydrogenase
VSGTRGRIVTVDGHRLQGVSGEQGPLRELPTAPYPQPYEQFLDAIQAGAGASSEDLVETRFQEGYRAAQLVDAAYLSIAERRWVDL